MSLPAWLRITNSLIVCVRFSIPIFGNYSPDVLGHMHNSSSSSLPFFTLAIKKGPAVPTAEQTSLIILLRDYPSPPLRKGYSRI